MSTLTGFRIFSLHLLLLLIPQVVIIVAAEVEPYSHQEVKDETTETHLNIRRTSTRQSTSATSSAVHIDTKDEDFDVRQLIVGGEEAAEGAYPYFVDVGACGASLIAPDMVLTVSHCGLDKTIVVGAYYDGDNSTENAKSVQIVERVQHPGYDYPKNDMALLRIDPPVYQNTNITLVLPEVDDIVMGESLTIMGLGKLREDADDDGVSTLREVTVLQIPSNICNGTGLYDGNIDDSMFCAGHYEGGKDACVSDSGGPIVRKVGNVHVQLGVISWGSGCGVPLRPGVYSRVHDKIEWIKRVGCGQWGSPATFCKDWSISSNTTAGPTLDPTPRATPLPTPDATPVALGPTTPSSTPPPIAASTKVESVGLRNRINLISFFWRVCGSLLLMGWFVLMMRKKRMATIEEEN